MGRSPIGVRSIRSNLVRCADEPVRSDRNSTLQRFAVVAVRGILPVAIDDQLHEQHLNLEPAELKRAAIRQLEDGLPVWFGCDVDQSFIQEEGIMDLDALAIDDLFGFSVVGDFDKAARLDYGESLMTHAMVLEGVNLDGKGRPTLWKVENSWGKDHAKDGFDTLTDAWFDEYVYQVVVDKKYLTDQQREAFETMEPIELAPWDPMGALA